MPQSPEDVILQRRATVARLYLQGWRQVDIARRECVSQGQISQDLEAIRKDWEASTIFDFNQAKIQELAKIDHLEQRAWEAWDNSSKPIKKKSQKVRGELNSSNTKDKQKAKNLETTESSEERLPDPRFMLVIDKMIEKRIRILGLEAPLKIANTDTEGKTVQSRTWTIINHTGGHRPPAPDDDYASQ